MSRVCSSHSRQAAHPAKAAKVGETIAVLWCGHPKQELAYKHGAHSGS